jgi:hypothetical protein
VEKSIPEQLLQPRQGGAAGFCHILTRDGVTKMLFDIIDRSFQQKKVSHGFTSRYYAITLL